MPTIKSTLLRELTGTATQSFTQSVDGILYQGYRKVLSERPVAAFKIAILVHRLTIRQYWMI